MSCRVFTLKSLKCCITSGDLKMIENLSEKRILIMEPRKYGSDICGLRVRGSDPRTGIYRSYSDIW